MGEPQYELLYKDKDLLIVDKPGGLLSVPLPEGDSVNLLEMMYERYGQQSPPIQAIHRIDRFTSGIMIFSRHGKAHTRMVDQLKSGKIVRRYLAVVKNQMEQWSGTLEHHLKLIKDGFQNIVVSPGVSGATPARLHYKVLEPLQNAALVQIELETGLKNQIRVQFAAVGHPLIGDRQYGEGETNHLLDRQALHAEYVEFLHPIRGTQIKRKAPLPEDMGNLIKKLRLNG